MALKLRQMVGRKLVRATGEYEEIRLPQDEIVVENRAYPNGRRVGIVGHHKGAGLCLFEELPETMMADLKRLVDERDGASRDRKISVAPPMEAKETE